jgi:hypothetical protein
MFEISPISSSSITSTSAAHCWHCARLVLRPLKINKDSVSTRIFVRFAMSIAIPADLRIGTCAAWQNPPPEVLSNALKSSEYFLQPVTLEEPAGWDFFDSDASCLG